MLLYLFEVVNTRRRHYNLHYDEINRNKTAATCDHTDPFSQENTDRN